MVANVLDTLDRTVRHDEHVHDQQSRISEKVPSVGPFDTTIGHMAHI